MTAPVASDRRAGGPSVLLVGKAAPDRGGIARYLDTVHGSDLGRDGRVRLLNLAHTGEPEGGRATVGNVRRTLHDAVAVLRQAPAADVVHLHTALVPTVTLLRAGLLAGAARARGRAVVVHVHGGNLGSWLVGRGRRVLVRAALRPATRVVTVWEAGRRSLADVLGDERVVLLDNGVDVERFRPPVDPRSRRVPRVLYVGLLTERKGVLDLVEASRLLRCRGVPHELCLVGGTPDEGPVAEQEVRSRLDERVRLLGSRPPERMPEVYEQADVFCLPSWWEAMPLSVLEAMASGLPVVTTDVGDTARVVLHDRSGLVVPVHSPVALADALERLLTDAALRRRMGEAGRARVVERFSTEAMIPALRQLYADVTEVRP